MVVSSAAMAADEGAFSVGMQPSYFEGDYGTGKNVKITYVPFYLKYKQGDASFKVTIPYISVKSGGALVSGGTVIGTSTTTGTRSGLGDIWLEGKYKLHTADGLVPNLVPYVKIKLPTASKSDGLGTGKTDYELGSGFEWTIGKSVFPFVKAGYRFVGKPSGKNLRNIVTYQAGSTFALAPRNYLTLMYSGREATQSGFSSASDVLIAWDFQVGKGTSLQLYGDKGLSNGSPDFGLGAGISVKF